MSGEEKFAQYDLYLSFLSKKVNLLESMINHINLTENEKKFLEDLTSNYILTADSTKEFTSGWGARGRDNNNNSYRPIILDKINEIKFNIKRTINIKLEVKFYTELELKTVFFLDFDQVVPVIESKNGVYTCIFSLPPKMHSGEISLVTVCPPSEREYYKEKSVVFLSLRTY